MKIYKSAGKILLTASVLLTFGQMARCQTVFYPSNSYTDELVLGFRKTGTHIANHEVVIDAGPAANYTSLAIGNSLTVPNFTQAQLLNAFPDLTFLNWSVSGASSTLNGYPAHTLWVTVPRSNPSVVTTAPQRLTKSAQQANASPITSILGGGQSFSQNEASNSLNNTQYLIQEPINTSPDLTTFMGDSSSPTNSDLNGTWPANIENITGSPFSTASVSDFYEVRPTGVTDPHTGLTSGNAYYLGYFTLGTNGTLRFTRAVSYTPPPATRVTITRTNTTTTISFGTTNGATYTVYYTNLSGLNKPTSTWPTIPGTVTGNGLTNHVNDTTTDTNRIYRVGAH
ncbi:MAG TPA: hypothetical protein VFB72_16830 [Verrucomicrobiae bacterium]|nr:hypothetical protein [Verrucomicrobiae bacterium]